MSSIDIPVACFDLNSPADIVFGIKNGIKIFGGQYSFIMAHQHKAFSLPNKDHPNRKCVIIDFKDKERHKNDTGIAPTLKFRTWNSSNLEYFELKFIEAIKRKDNGGQ